MSDPFQDEEETRRPTADREETTRAGSNGGSNDVDYEFWNAADESAATPASSAPRWRTAAGVALLLGLIAAVTFVVVGALVDRKPTASAPTPPATNSPAPSTPVTSSPSKTSLSSTSASSAPSSAAVVPPPAVSQPPAVQAPATPQQDAPAPTTPPPPAQPSASASAVPSEPASFPSTTGRHCRTAAGAPTSTTQTDVRQALTKSSSCAFLVDVRDAVHAHAAANGRGASFSLHLYSAYRKQQQPETDGYVDLTCTRADAFVECMAQDPPVDIWVRDPA